MKLCFCSLGQRSGKHTVTLCLLLQQVGSRLPSPRLHLENLTHQGVLKIFWNFKKPKVWGSFLAILAVILAAVFCLTGQKTEDDTSASQSEQQVTDSSRSAQAEAAKQETEAARQMAEQTQQDAASAEDAKQAAAQKQKETEKAGRSCRKCTPGNRGTGAGHDGQYSGRT